MVTFLLLYCLSRLEKRDHVSGIKHLYEPVSFLSLVFEWADMYDTLSHKFDIEKKADLLIY